MFSDLSKKVKVLFDDTVANLSKDDVLFVMPAFYPQRGGILEEVVAKGGKAIIAGGAPKQQLFKGIVQYSPGFDTTGISETPKEIHEIVSAIPSEIVKGKKVALFVEAPVKTPMANGRPASCSSCALLAIASGTALGVPAAVNPPKPTLSS